MTPHLALVAESEPFLFISGQLPLGPSQEIVGEDVATQTHQAIANVAAILKREGLSLNDVVKTTVWIKSAADFVDFNTAYAADFGPHRPARSTVVSELVLPAALVEIEAIARRSFGRAEKR